MPTDASDDDIEDWLHFVIDSLQFAGGRIACDEIDLDQVRPCGSDTWKLGSAHASFQAIVDLRNVLEERPQDPSPKATTDLGNPHLFLVLDKGLHAFPWESLPCLDGVSTSRLPSLDLLRDALDLQETQGHSAENDFGLTIDPKKVFYVLNPGADLKHTQKEFASILGDKPWQGIAERAPMEEEMRRALTSAHAFL